MICVSAEEGKVRGSSVVGVYLNMQEVFFLFGGVGLNPH
jgi:hypothetical protein